jgi:hypothetical protein
METLSNVITATQLQDALANEEADKVVRISYRQNAPTAEDTSYPKFLLCVGSVNGKEFTVEKSVWSYTLDSGSAFKKPVSEDIASGDITVSELSEILQNIEADKRVFLDGGSHAPALYTGQVSGFKNSRHLTDASIIWKN